jgi:hypothetical protein
MTDGVTNGMAPAAKVATAMAPSVTATAVTTAAFCGKQRRRKEKASGNDDQKREPITHGYSAAYHQFNLLQLDMDWQP